MIYSSITTLTHLSLTSIYLFFLAFFLLLAQPFKSCLLLLLLLPSRRIRELMHGNLLPLPHTSRIPPPFIPCCFCCCCRCRCNVSCYCCSCFKNFCRAETFLWPLCPCCTRRAWLFTWLGTHTNRCRLAHKVKHTHMENKWNRKLDTKNPAPPPA